MYNSIHQFNENGIKNLEKTFMDFSQDLTKFAEMIEGVSREIVQLGLNTVAEELEYYDEQLRQNRHMRAEWHKIWQMKCTGLFVVEQKRNSNNIQRD